MTDIQSKELILSYVNNGKPFTVFYDIDRFITQVLIGKEYEPFYNNFVPKSDLTVLDLGCNIGTFSLSVYDRASKIYAVDFSNRSIDLLKKTIEHNQFDKIVPVKTAVAGENKEVHVTDIENSMGGNSIYGTGEVTQAITVATLFKQYNIDNIDLMKVDIESAEDEIFTADDFKDIAPKISVMVGELHGGRSIKEILEPLGFAYDQFPPHFRAVRKP